VGDDLVASLLDPNVATLIGAVHFDIAYALIATRPFPSHAAPSSLTRAGPAPM
jgi:hypothetical protein